MKPINNIDIVEKLEQFRHKGAAWQSQHKATKLLGELKHLLTDNEYWELNIAHSHYEIGENTSEIYAVCKQLIEKYSETSIKVKN